MANGIEIGKLNLLLSEVLIFVAVCFISLIAVNFKRLLGRNGKVEVPSQIRSTNNLKNYKMVGTNKVKKGSRPIYFILM